MGAGWVRAHPVGDEDALTTGSTERPIRRCSTVAAARVAHERLICDAAAHDELRTSAGCRTSWRRGGAVRDAAPPDEPRIARAAARGVCPRLGTMRRVRARGAATCCLLKLSASATSWPACRAPCARAVSCGVKMAHRVQGQAPQRLRRVAGDYVSPRRVAPGTRARRPSPRSPTAARRPTTRHTRRVWSPDMSHGAWSAAGGHSRTRACRGSARPSLSSYSPLENNENIVSYPPDSVRNPRTFGRTDQVS